MLDVDYAIQLMDLPDLSIVKPGIKCALRGDAVTELIPFVMDVTDGSQGNVTASHVPNISDTRYFDNVLSEEECAILVEKISSSEHLSFWNSDESKRETAQLFRDADTIEIEAPKFANYMWKKIIPFEAFDKITIGVIITFETRCMVNAMLMACTHTTS